MSWIHAFELLCYILTAILLWDMVSRKDIGELKLFLSGAIAGFALELLAVRLTDIYHYNPDFWLNIGRRPFQFPVFGGLMWGGLTVCSLRLARRLGFGKVMTALVTGFLIVSMDLLLDVAAIRLDGGFWVWDGREINNEVNHHMFMSVIWVNFLGYMFETPIVAWLTLKDQEKGIDRPWWKHLLASVLIAFGGIAFVGACSGISLELNAITDEWFAFIAFLLVWGFVLVCIIIQYFRHHLTGKREFLAVFFFTAMYAYCFAAIIIPLRIASEHFWLAFLGIPLLALTEHLGLDKAGRRNGLQ